MELSQALSEVCVCVCSLHMCLGFRVCQQTRSKPGETQHKIGGKPKHTFPYFAVCTM